MIAVITFGLAYYGNAYVTKTRLGDSARVIARAIQDDPGISQGNVNNPFGDLGDLEQVVAAATGNGEAIPAGFNPASYKSCNPDLAGLSDEMAQSHFARAGRYEGRQGIFGDCGAGGNVAARDVRVNITSYASKPTISQIKAQIPPNSVNTSSAEIAEIIHPSGKNSMAGFFGWKYANPNTDPSKPYWVSVVAKKPVRQLSLFGWIFGSSSEIVNHAVVRVVPPPYCEGPGKVLRSNAVGQFVCESLRRTHCYWAPLPQNTQNIWCADGYSVVSLAYEGGTWTNETDNHIHPEIYGVDCCKFE